MIWIIGIVAFVFGLLIGGLFAEYWVKKNKAVPAEVEPIGPDTKFFLFFKEDTEPAWQYYPSIDEISSLAPGKIIQLPFQAPLVVKKWEFLNNEVHIFVDYM